MLSGSLFLYQMLNDKLSASFTRVCDLLMLMQNITSSHSKIVAAVKESLAGMR
jgi:hypothetical protein